MRIGNDMLKDKEQNIVLKNKAALVEYQTNKASLGVIQYDKVTGKKLNTFRNRYQAASWIISNSLTNYKYKGIGETRCAIAGALTAALSKTPYAYGYMWKYVINPVDVAPVKRLSGFRVDPSTVVSIYDRNGNRKDYDTIKNACIAHGISNRFRTETLKNQCHKNGLIVYVREKQLNPKSGKRIIK